MAQRCYNNHIYETVDSQDKNYICLTRYARKKSKKQYPTKENVNDTTEKLIHKEYYNFNSDAGKDDYTHPNYRGYAKIAEHVKPLLEYLLDGKPAPII